MLRARGSSGAGVAPIIVGAGNIAGSSSATKTAQMNGTALLGPGLLVAGACWHGVAGISLSSVTDLNSNTWTVLSSVTRDNGATSCGVALAYCYMNAPIQGSDAAYTVTFNLSAAVTNFNHHYYLYPDYGSASEMGIAVGTTGSGNSTNPALAAFSTPNVTGTRTGGIAIYCWATNTAATSGGSFTERYDGRISTAAARYYGQTRQDLAPNTSITPSTVMATAADWAATSMKLAHFSTKPRSFPREPRGGRQMVVSGARR